MDAHTECPTCGKRKIIEKPVYDPKKRIMYYKGDEVHFSFVESEIFEVLIENFPESISDHQFNNRAFGHRDIDPINNRKVHVSRMRKKLKPYGIKIHRIRSFWCAGYESGGYFLTIQ
jgi:DNA-binding response OmpR family regulator